jgi:hypothetical protein
VLQGDNAWRKYSVIIGQQNLHEKSSVGRGTPPVFQAGTAAVHDSGPDAKLQFKGRDGGLLFRLPAAS